MVKKVALAACLLACVAALLFFMRELETISEEDLVSVSDLTYLSSEDAFYAYEIEGGEPQGFTIEVLDLAWKEMGFERGPEITFRPWAVVYKKVLHEKGVVGLNAYRVPERESIIKFACPILVEEIVVVEKKEANIQINEIDDYKKYKYGALNAGVSEKRLLDGLSLGVEQVTRAKDYFVLTRMLREGRVDFIADSAIVLAKAWESQKYPPEEIKVHKVLGELSLCLAVNKQVPDKLVEQLTQALQKVNGSEAYQQVVEKYVPVEYLEHWRN